MTKGLLLIDGNSLCHAAHHGTTLSVGDMQTQAIFGMVKSVRGLAESHPEYGILVLWDGVGHWRKELLHSYKANRVAKDEKQQLQKDSYQDQSPYVRKALQLLGVRQMFATSLEADDLAGIIVKRSTTPITLVSGDQDWLQLVNENVMWFDPIRDRKVTLESFPSFTGYFNTQEFLQGKALRGDTSDNIPGVGGIGEKGAPEFLAQFKTVEHYFALCDAGTFVPKKVAHKNLASLEGRAAFARNMKLMSLLDVPSPPKEDLVIIPTSYNEDAFRAMCERLAFMSILRGFDTFLTPFRALQEPLLKAA